MLVIIHVERPALELPAIEFDPQFINRAKLSQQAALHVSLFSNVVNRCLYLDGGMTEEHGSPKLSVKNA